MEIKHFIIMLLLACLLIACNNRQSESVYYEFEREEIIKIPINDPEIRTYSHSFFDYCTIDDIETLIVYLENNKLSFYNVENKEKYHEIELFDRSLDAFEYINKDSILLLYSYPENFNEIEKFQGMSMLDTSKLVLVDYSGNVKKYYHFNCGQDNFNSTNYTIDQILPPYTLLFYKNIKRVGDIVFFFPFEYGCYNFDSLENNAPLIAYYDLSTEIFTFSKNVKLPYLKEKMYYPSNFDVLNFCISANGLPLLRFFYSSDVFEWDYKSDELIKHSLKSKFIDTIPYLDHETNNMNAIDARYSDIYYDKHNEMYYSRLWFSNETYGESYFSLIIADNNFNYIDELFEPRFGSSPKFVDDKIIFYFAASDTIYLVKDKLVKKNGFRAKDIKSARELLEKSKNEKELKVQRYANGRSGNALVNFLSEKTDINDMDYCILTIYVNDGCLGCSETVLRTIEDNINVFSQVPLYLIFTGSDADINNELSKYEIEDIENIVLDNEGIVKNLTYNASILNPRLTVIKDNKVKLDTICSSFDIETALIPALIDNLGLVFASNR